MKFADLQKMIDQGALDAEYLKLGLQAQALPSLHLAHRLKLLGEMSRDLLGCADNDEVRLFTSPGRIVLLGEFMEALGGQQLGGPIQLDILALVRYRADQQCTLASWGYEELFKVDLDRACPAEEIAGLPTAYLYGMARSLQDSGAQLKGCDICLHSRLPTGMGLSSSSAFALLMGKILSAHPGASMATPLTDLQLARLAARSKSEYFGRSASMADPLTCLGGPVKHLDFQAASPGLNSLTPAMLIQDYSLFLVETWEAFDDEEDERDILVQELAELNHQLQKQGQPPLLQLTADKLLALLPGLRKDCGDRICLRGLYMLDEFHRISQARRAIEAPQGLGTLLELINISTATAYRQLQNLWPEAHSRSRSLALGIELTERWLRSMGMPGAVHVHGHGFYGSLYVLIPRNKSGAFQTYMQSLFGPESATELFFRAKGVSQIG